MAFNFFGDLENPDDEKKQPSGGVAGGMVEKSLGQQSPVVTGNKQDQQQKAAPGDPTRSGSFTNLQSYLDQNASLNQGGRVAGRTQESVDAAKQQQQQTDTAFRGRVDQNTVRTDDALIGKVKQDPTQIFRGVKPPNTNPDGRPRLVPMDDSPPATRPPNVPRLTPALPEFPGFAEQKPDENGLYAKPTPPPPTVVKSEPISIAPTRGFVPNEGSDRPLLQPSNVVFKGGVNGKNAPLDLSSPNSQADAFAKMRDAKYGGPQTLTDAADLYSPTYEKTRSADESAKLTESEGGRKALLDKFYGSGANRFDYTAGQKKLDNLLISNDSTAKQAFQDVRDKNTGVQKNFDDLKAALDSYGKAGATETARARTESRGAVGIDDAGNVLDNSGIKQTYKSVADRLAAEQSAKTEEVNRLRSQLASGAVDKDLAKKIGLPFGLNTWTRNAADARYLHEGADPTLNAIASGDEQAKVAALSKLANVDNTWLPDSQVGGYDQSQRFNYDMNLLKTDAQGDSARYNDEYNRNRWGNNTQTGGIDDNSGVAGAGGVYGGGGVSAPFVSGSLAANVKEAQRIKSIYDRDPVTHTNNDYQYNMKRINEILGMRDRLQRDLGYTKKLGVK